MIDSYGEKDYVFFMPKVKVQCNSSISAKEAFDRVSQLLDKDPDLRKLDNSFECQFDEANLSGTAKGKLFKADMTISDSNPGASVEIIVDLPLTLALAKGMVAKTLQKKLDKALA